MANRPQEQPKVHSSRPREDLLLAIFYQGKLHGPSKTKTLDPVCVWVVLVGWIFFGSEDVQQHQRGPTMRPLDVFNRDEVTL